jgi:hypothetical protein
MYWAENLPGLQTELFIYMYASKDCNIRESGVLDLWRLHRTATTAHEATLYHNLSN